jgi:hypothetical protein
MDPREIVIAEMRKQTALLGAILLALNERRTITPTDGAAAAERVPEALLAGPYGDPEVKAKDPRDWSGPSQKGKHFSECPPDYLDLLADRYDYFAGNETDPTKAGYNRKDAQRARGWAQRLRAGWTPPVTAGRVNEADGEPRW